MPYFYRVHVTVAGIGVVILVVPLPLLLTALAGSFSIGLVAIMVLFFGIVLWSELLNATSLFAVIALVILMLMPRSAEFELASLWSGQYELQALLILLLGLVIVAGVGVRLFRLNEEMWGYSPASPSKTETESRSLGHAKADEPTLIRGLNWWLHDSQMGTSIHHARHASTSQWSSFCRWQVGMTVGWLTWLVSLGAILLILLLFWIVDSIQSTLVIFLFCSIILPSSLLIGTFAQRSHMLAFDLSLPVDRRTYFSQLGKALVLSQLQLWLAMNIAAIIMYLIIIRQPIPTATVVSVLVISALFQVFMFGTAARFSLVYADETGMLVLLVAAIPLLTCWGFSRPFSAWQSAPMAIMAFFAAFGLLLARSAYRRWLVVDIK